MNIASDINNHLRDIVRKKTGLCGKNSQVADPLIPLISKKSWVYFSF